MIEGSMRLPTYAVAVQGDCLPHAWGTIEQNWTTHKEESLKGSASHPWEQDRHSQENMGLYRQWGQV